MNDKNCRGSLMWPAYRQGTYTFFCDKCGRTFARSELEGRDDHMPTHSTPAQEIDAIALDYVAKGWTDLGLVSGTRTLQKRSDAASSPFVAIWAQTGDCPRVVSEQY